MHDEKIVGCTQPRGSAASSAATQVAREMELPLGGIVGCQSHSGDCDRSGGDTRLKFLADSVLLQEFVSRRGFHDYVGYASFRLQLYLTTVGMHCR